MEELLIFIAGKSNFYNFFESSTKEISRELNCSQQTVSRKLIDLEKEKLIERRISSKGVSLRLTKKGKELLEKKYRNLMSLFEERKKIISGKVFTGLGEGAYYIKHYSKILKEIIGFTPFEGTLNIKVNETEAANFLDSLKSIKINEFKKGNRTFGGVNCFKVKINSVEGALLIPERTNHARDTLELIAPVFLRKKFNLKDESEVKVYG
ncbi:MAG TPA: DUF120 domain-containing protein [archaeon]|nr:DUF120 domain-containing protein [archaeon]